MYRFTCVVCVGLAIVFNSGCEPGPKRPPLVPVKGTVNLDGKPMAEGEVIFSVTGEPPQVMPITNGNFSGEANEGKNRVEIKKYKQGPPLSTDPKGPPTKINILPDRFNTKTTQHADVSAGGANNFKFDVTSN